MFQARWWQLENVDWTMIGFTSARLKFNKSMFSLEKLVCYLLLDLFPNLLLVSSSWRTALDNRGNYLRCFLPLSFYLIFPRPLLANCHVFSFATWYLKSGTLRSNLNWHMLWSCQCFSTCEQLLRISAIFLSETNIGKIYGSLAFRD